MTLESHDRAPVLVFPKRGYYKALRFTTIPQQRRRQYLSSTLWRTRLKLRQPDGEYNYHPHLTEDTKLGELSEPNIAAWAVQENHSYEKRENRWPLIGIAAIALDHSLILTNQKGQDRLIQCDVAETRFFDLSAISENNYALECLAAIYRARWPDRPLARLVRSPFINRHAFPEIEEEPETGNYIAYRVADAPAEQRYYLRTTVPLQPMPVVVRQELTAGTLPDAHDTSARG